MNKLCKPVLIDTNKADNSLLLFNLRGCENLEYHKDKFFTQDYLKSINLKLYHLYIISLDPDEKIDEEDCILRYKEVGKIIKNSLNELRVQWQPRKVTTAFNSGVMIAGRKIIASTDESLGLPQPSPEYIQQFIEEYEVGKMNDVKVEYENQKLDLIVGKEYLLDKTDWKINIPETKGVYTRSIKVTDYREEAGFHINAKVLIDPKEETIIGCSENCLYLNEPIKIPKLTDNFITIHPIESIVYTEEEVRMLFKNASNHYYGINNISEWFEINKKK